MSEEEKQQLDAKENTQDDPNWFQDMINEGTAAESAADGKKKKKQRRKETEATAAEPAPSAEEAEQSAEEASPSDGEETETPQDDGPKRNKYADKMNKSKGGKHKRLKRIIFIVVILAVIAAAVALVVRSRRETDTDAGVQTTVVTRGMLETYIEGDGFTAANKREELGKDLKGTVTSVRVQVGDQVKAGDELFVVNPTETRKELETAQEELAEAQRSVTEAQNEVTQAQSRVASAQKNLSKLNVTAPFSGKIIPELDGDDKSVEFKVGQQISSGTVIGNMVDDSTMKLSLYFSSAYSGEIKSGQTANVSIPAAMSTVTGSVSSIESAQKVSAEGVKLFRVVVTMKNPGTLSKGMTATATVTTPGAGEVYPAESGTLEYNREEAVTAQVSGEVTSVGGLDYYNYSSGAVIMRISSDETQDTLQTAQNEVVSARQQVVNAQKTVSAKQDRVKELTELIQDATVKSPIDGVVVSLTTEEGAEAAGGTPLAVVADMEDIIVNANIASTDVMNVQSGQMATMTMYTPDGDLTLTGWVDSVAMEPSQDSSGGQGSMPTFPAVIKLDPIEGQTVTIGQSVTYRITTASSMDSLIVPSSAVVNTEEGTAVFVKVPAEGEEPEVPQQENTDMAEPAGDDVFADSDLAGDDFTDDFVDGDFIDGDFAGDAFTGGSTVIDYAEYRSKALPIPEGTEVPDGFLLIPVETGISDSTNTEILWGLDEGVTVLLAGPQDMYADMGDGTIVYG